MRVIRTEAELRAVIGTEPPGLAEKNQPRLTGFAMDFIAKSSRGVLRPDVRCRRKRAFGSCGRH
ncbi:MAG: hypothetical protein OXF68_16140 [Gammaproteobacteria bacterium]|nr:hypothetical protein [Gammaproteobacteria bacterium]MCY4344600.1 hypothetical protein [Gammaproteobacteria bacterium]